MRRFAKLGITSIYPGAALLLSSLLTPQNHGMWLAVDACRAFISPLLDVIRELLCKTLVCAAVLQAHV